MIEYINRHVGYLFVLFMYEPGKLAFWPFSCLSRIRCTIGDCGIFVNVCGILHLSLHFVSLRGFSREPESPSSEFVHAEDSHNRPNMKHLPTQRTRGGERCWYNTQIRKVNATMAIEIVIFQHTPSLRSATGAEALTLVGALACYLFD